MRIYTDQQTLAAARSGARDYRPLIARRYEQVVLHNGLALAAAAALLVVVTLLATLAPALRAARTDPATVLRGE